VGWFDADAAYAVDMDLWARILAQGDLYFVPEPLASFRVSPGQWSVKLADSQARDVERLLARLQAEPGWDLTSADLRAGARSARRQAWARRTLYAALALRRGRHAKVRAPVSIEHVCPECGAPLPAAVALDCECGAVWRRVAGIPDFAMDHSNDEVLGEQQRRLSGMSEMHFWNRARASLVDRLVARWVPDGSRVLDAGSGPGATTRRMLARGFTVAAVDLSMDGLAAARDAGAIVARADLTCLPFADATFDAVLMLDVIEHTDDVAALAQVARVLAPGGVAIITVPAWPGLWSARDVVAGHVRRYTPRALLDVLASGGFTIERRGFFGFLAMPAFVVQRALARNSESALRREEHPPAIVNALFGAIYGLEVLLGRWIPWPTGSSIYVVARRPL
ncbi:MAG TPA: class I SAM-dependent methyltransferase, partial [Coriobacteriia bacterium]